MVRNCISSGGFLSTNIGVAAESCTWIPGKHSINQRTILNFDILIDNIIVENHKANSFWSTESLQANERPYEWIQ